MKYMVLLYGEARAGPVVTPSKRALTWLSHESAAWQRRRVGGCSKIGAWL
jgi:hypothetical protein